MISPLRMLAAGATAATILLGSAGSPNAQGFSEPQRREIEKIMREYLLKNPELLQEVVAELEKRQAASEAERQQAGVAKYRDTIFNSQHQAVIGNPQGDVTLVEFFDYNCGYCKRALGDKLELIKSDPKLRIVLKEFPVLGPGSIEAAQVSIAVRMQDGGKKYLEFHQKLLSSRGQADRARALAVAREVGLDVARIEKDVQSAEVRESLEEVMQVAEALSINGTPTYVIGTTITPGAIGLTALRQQIAAARKASR